MKRFTLFRILIIASVAGTAFLVIVGFLFLVSPGLTSDGFTMTWRWSPSGIREYYKPFNSMFHSGNDRIDIFVDTPCESSMVYYPMTETAPARKEISSKKGMCRIMGYFNKKSLPTGVHWILRNDKDARAYYEYADDGVDGAINRIAIIDGESVKSYLLWNNEQLTIKRQYYDNPDDVAAMHGDPVLMPASLDAGSLMLEVESSSGAIQTYRYSPEEVKGAGGSRGFIGWINAEGIPEKEFKDFNYNSSKFLASLPDEMRTTIQNIRDSTDRDHENKQNTLSRKARNNETWVPRGVIEQIIK